MVSGCVILTGVVVAAAVIAAAAPKATASNKITGTVQYACTSAFFFLPIAGWHAILLSLIMGSFV